MVVKCVVLNWSSSWGWRSGLAIIAAIGLELGPWSPMAWLLDRRPKHHTLSETENGSCTRSYFGL